MWFFPFSFGNPSRFAKASNRQPVLGLTILAFLFQTKYLEK
jgi:hypothetical protein